nr:uncharacterized protein LOC112030849 [Quercus suber]
MDLLIDSAAGNTMFSFMDGFSGYNQIRMAPRDAEKIAFRTPMGNFYYTVMPFGLKNAGKEQFPLDDEVLGEVAIAEEVREQRVMKFDRSSTTQSDGVEVVLYHEEDKAVTLSFKLKFSCSKNMAEYEAYLTGLAMALEMGVKHLRVLGDSNLIGC